MNGRFVSYYRVSRASQGANGLGIDAQKREVANYLNGGAWELVGEFVEVESGKRDDRPELAKAIALCKLTNSRLLIAKLDRLSRDVHFLTGLEKQGVDFVACDLPNANKFTVHVMAALAQQERELISRRTKDSLQSIKDRIAAGETYVSKNSGKVVTKLGNPEGLKHRRSDLGVAAIKANADEFAGRVGATIRDLRKAGLSMAQIADRLNELNYQTPRGGKWAAMTVKRVMDRIAD